MKTQMSNNSLEAYSGLNITSKENDVLILLLSMGISATSLMMEDYAIAIGSKLRRNTITGRLNSLEEKRVLKSVTGKCTVSGNSAKFYSKV